MTLEEAVQKALEDCGTSVLSNPTLFRNYLMDCLDVNLPARRVLRRSCDASLLSPLARAVERDEDVRGVTPLIEYHLHNTCMINEEVSHSIASDLVEGVRRYTGGEDDSKGADDPRKADAHKEEEDEEKPVFFLPAQAESVAAPEVSAWTCAQGVNYQLDSRATHKGCAAILRMKNTRYTNVVVHANLALASGEVRARSVPLVPGGQGILAFGDRIREVESFEVLATSDTSPSHCLAWHIVAGDGRGAAGKTCVHIYNLSGLTVQVRDVLLEAAPSQSVARVDIPSGALGPRESMRIPVPYDMLGKSAWDGLQPAVIQARLRVYVNGARILADANAQSTNPKASSSSGSAGAHAGGRKPTRGTVGGLRYEVINDWVQPCGSSLLFLYNDSWYVLSAKVHVRSRNARDNRGAFDKRMTIGPMAPAEKRLVVLPAADVQVESLSATNSGGELFGAWCSSWNSVANRWEELQRQNTPVTRLVVEPQGHVGTAVVVSKEDKKLWKAMIDEDFSNREGFQLVVAGELHNPRMYIDGVGIDRDERLDAPLRTKGVWGHHKNMVRHVPAEVLSLWRTYGL